METSEVSEEQVKLLSDVFKVIATHRKLDVPEPDIEKMRTEFEVKLGHISELGNIVFFPSELESAGTRRLLLLMNKVFKALDDGRTIVIDEIDASLHTFLVESIVNLFVNSDTNPKGAQLIATTHDTNLLSSEILRRDEVWFVEKDLFGASHYYSLAEIKSRKGEAFERAYLQGRYGAVPPRTRFSIIGDASESETNVKEV